MRKLQASRRNATAAALIGAVMRPARKRSTESKASATTHSSARSAGGAGAPSGPLQQAGEADTSVQDGTGADVIHDDGTSHTPAASGSGGSSEQTAPERLSTADVQSRAHGIKGPLFKKFQSAAMVVRAVGRGMPGGPELTPLRCLLEGIRFSGG